MPKLDLKSRLAQKRRRKFFNLLAVACLGIVLINLLFNLMVKLPANQDKSVDAIFVLGGSIRREIYAAQLAKEFPELPILISQGSKDPCIWRIFQREGAPFAKIWLENCANSTFDNFFFGVPILSRWGVHKVKLVTSGSHLPRAKWLGQIHLGSRGIAVELETVPEMGIPGNREFVWKTRLDVTRSLIWAVFSQLIGPPCFRVTNLAEVDLNAWNQTGFECEHQGGVE